VVTETDGKYQISAPQGATLEFRFVGMKTSEVVVDSASVYDVGLEYELFGVDEVVVIGYGTQIKSKSRGVFPKSMVLS